MAVAQHRRLARSGRGLRLNRSEKRARYYSHTLQTLHDMGLDYLHLGESTPTLSGDEAQLLKLVAHMGRSQKDTLFVFDEPSVGLHPWMFKR